jgi:O-antigen/teichoic acid export membrane protein
MDALFTRLLRNAGLLLGGKAANAVLSLVVLAVAARALGPEGLGRLVLLQSLVQLVAELVKFQSWQGVVRFGTARPDDFDRIVSFSLLLDLAAALVGTAVLVLGGGWLARRLGWPDDVAALVPFYATALLALVPGTAQGVLRLFDRFDWLAVQSASANAVRLIGALAAWGLGGGLESFALVWWLAALAAGVLPFVPAWRLRRVRPVWPAGIRIAHPGILRFFCLTSANSIIALAPGHLAALIIGTLLGPAAAGLFRVAKQVADAAAKPADFLAQALYPEAARLAADGKGAKLRAVLLRLGMVSAVVGGAALAVIAGFGETLVVLVAGRDFSGAVVVMAWLAAAAAVAMAASPAEPTLIALGQAGGVVVAKGAAALLHVVLLAVLVPLSGLTGAGMAALVAASLSGLLLWRAVLRTAR